MVYPSSTYSTPTTSWAQTSSSPAAAQNIVSTGVFVSSTPETELQMGHGLPVCFRVDIEDQRSLGIDCHSNNFSDMITQMRLGLQSARAVRNEALIGKGETPIVKISGNGAKAVHMQEIGSLVEGKRADIVVFDALSPGMVCAAEHDPIVAIVLHASVADIETVIVDGFVRKRSGKLVKVVVEEGIAGIGKWEIVWAGVAEQLVRSRREIQKRIEKIDMDKALEAFLKTIKEVERTLDSRFFSSSSGPCRSLGTPIACVKCVEEIAVYFLMRTALLSQGS
ncbi:hypothetical protein ACJ73_05246 [Blastomyces percursus]|uniref:Amidohydrolase-related domain-containing protein n=1 Tax=Blastomyces percursus TaxID=1658174 RepID=A0A1J9QT45_9EURO|nr:hypothetical protein ACJ73_05246 [Blastomyces percursus]